MTAVPFLTITPDAKAAGLGETGVASTSNIAPIHWNVAGLSFQSERFGASYNHSPWLSKIISDISLTYFTTYYKINSKHALAGSLRYFDLGDIFYSSPHPNTQLKTFKPMEYAIDIGYSFRLSESMALGLAVRYFQTTIAGNFSSSTIKKRISRGVGLDFGFLYLREFQILQKESEWTFGFNISNLGPRIVYSDEDNKDPIPSNLRVGSRISWRASSAIRLNINLDLNKLLVPTRPVYEIDPTTGALVIDPYGYPIIAKGKDPNRGFFGNLVGSFSDAPGGLKEEFQEVITTTGLELIYKEKFVIRTGIFNEHEFKGNRKFLTLGAGIIVNSLSVDVSYLLPRQQIHPLSETLRFSINFVSS